MKDLLLSTQGCCQRLSNLTKLRMAAIIVISRVRIVREEWAEQVEEAPWVDNRSVETAVSILLTQIKVVNPRRKITTTTTCITRSWRLIRKLRPRSSRRIPLKTRTVSYNVIIRSFYHLFFNSAVPRVRTGHVWDQAAGPPKCCGLDNAHRRVDRRWARQKSRSWGQVWSTGGAVELHRGLTAGEQSLRRSRAQEARLLRAARN